MLKSIRSTLLALAAIPIAACAQDAYPTKLVTIVTPQPAGSGSNIVGRLVAERMSQRLKQSVIVVAKPGAGGAIAAEFVARAKPDGYTLMVGSAGQMVVNPLISKLSYAPDQFVPLAHLGSLPNVLVVNARSQVKSIQDLVEKSKKTAAGLNYGSLGPGSIGETVSDVLVRQGGIRAVSIMYKSEPQAIIDLLGGQVDFVVAAVPAVLAHVNSGSLVALGVTSKTRSSRLPQVPPLSELGYPDINISQWYGLYGPAGMNKDIAGKITETVHAIYQDPSIPAKLSELSMDIPSTGEQDFGSFLRTENGKWSRLLKAGTVR